MAFVLNLQLALGRFILKLKKKEGGGVKKRNLTSTTLALKDWWTEKLTCSFLGCWFFGVFYSICCLSSVLYFSPLLPLTVLFGLQKAPSVSYKPQWQKCHPDCVDAQILKIPFKIGLPSLPLKTVSSTDHAAAHCAGLPWSTCFTLIADIFTLMNYRR